MSDDLKKRAALEAMTLVKPGMVLGLGTGSTADHFLAALSEAVTDGLEVVGVPTSERTMKIATNGGIKLTTLEENPRLDMTVDGADEIDPQLRLIKGAGGALLREKIVAAASEQMVVIADDSKSVDQLGAFALPVEVIPFGRDATKMAISAACEGIGLKPEIDLRCRADGVPLVTDCGHFIMDLRLGQIADPEALAEALSAIPGVVEHGLFIGLATLALVAGPEGVTKISHQQME